MMVVAAVMVIILISSGKKYECNQLNWAALLCLVVVLVVSSGIPKTGGRKKKGCQQISGEMTAKR